MAKKEYVYIVVELHKDDMPVLLGVTKDSKTADNLMASSKFWVNIIKKELV